MAYADFRLEELSERTLDPALAFLAEVFPPDVEEFRGELVEGLRDPEFCRRQGLHRVRRFVLLDGDAVIGTTGYYATTPELAWLSWFAVREDLRGQGIGEQMLDATIEIVRQDGFHDMHIWTNLHNDGAVDFYQRAGFRPYEIANKDDYRIVNLAKQVVP